MPKRSRRHPCRHANHDRRKQKPFGNERELGLDAHSTFWSVTADVLALALNGIGQAGCLKMRLI